MQTNIDIHVYGRVSFAKKDDRPDRTQDRSLQIQDELFSRACDELIPQLFGGRKGNIVGAYKDEGKSASRKRVRRPDFERLMRDIQSGFVKVLMVADLSRLTRLNHKDALRLHLLLDDHRVTL